MLNVGIFELLLIAGIALMVVGPEQLPKLFRSAGRWYGQARRAADELRRAFVLEADRQDAAERYRLLQERRQKRAEAQTTQFQPETVPQLPEDDPEAPAPAVASEPEEPVVDVNADPPDAPHPTRPVPPPVVNDSTGEADVVPGEEESR
ncbi:MAG: twin-arginine translocase TatA/TatE family subunit [Myxococcota bacterium]